MKRKDYVIVGEGFANRVETIEYQNGDLEIHCKWSPNCYTKMIHKKHADEVTYYWKELEGGEQSLTIPLLIMCDMAEFLYILNTSSTRRMLGPSRLIEGKELETFYDARKLD